MRIGVGMIKIISLVPNFQESSFHKIIAQVEIKATLFVTVMYLTLEAINYYYYYYYIGPCHHVFAYMRVCNVYAFSYDNLFDFSSF